MMKNLFGVNVVQMVLDELHSGGKVGLVELIRDVPALYGRKKD